MDYGLLNYYEGQASNKVNLGDFVQSFAAMQFLPRIDHFIERERLRSAESLPTTFAIMNGWFLHNKDAFLPPPNINPFYISFHLADKSILTNEVVTHLRRHEPIGCRDYSTINLLRSFGVRAYFSGCLTLTIPASRTTRNNTRYTVDYQGHLLSMIPANIASGMVQLTHFTHLIHTIEDLPLLSDMTIRDNSPEPKFFWHEDLFQEMRALIDKHHIVAVNSDFRQLSALLNLARVALMLRLYSRANLVVTLYLHCSLPCLALGTPVVLIRFNEMRTFAERMAATTPERFSALLDYIPIDFEDSLANVNWSPIPPDISKHAAFLKAIVRDAVSIHQNPLRDRSIEDYYNQAQWSPPHPGY